MRGEQLASLSRIVRASDSEFECSEDARVVGLEHVDRLQERRDARAHRRLEVSTQSRLQVAHRASVLVLQRQRLFDLVECPLGLLLLFPQDTGELPRRSGMPRSASSMRRVVKPTRSS